MKSIQRVRIKDSITTRLLTAVFSIYLLVTISVTAAHMMAEYSNMLIVTSVATTLFFGGWQSPPFLGFLPVPGLVWFLAKTYVLIFVIIWVRWTFPRLRVDQLLTLEWKYLLPLNLMNIVLMAVVIWLNWTI